MASFRKTRRLWNDQRRGEEGEEARARRRLIGQEIKLGLGEMARERERERESTQNTQFPTLVLIRRTLLLPPLLSLSLPGVPALHAQHVDSWFRLPHTVVKQVPLPPSLQPLKFSPSRPRISSGSFPIVALLIRFRGEGEAKVALWPSPVTAPKSLNSGARARGEGRETRERAAPTKCCGLSSPEGAPRRH